MLALYRAGRQADALDSYQAARAALDELGLEPSPELRALEQRILNHDPALDPPPWAAPTGAAPPRRGGLIGARSSSLRSPRSCGGPTPASSP